MMGLNLPARRLIEQRAHRLTKHSKTLSGYFQVLTARLRLLPDFIIIGAQKCGTTSLYQYLGQHPAIAPALKKEVHFFDSNFDRGVQWYRAHFPTVLYRHYARKVQGYRLITGEASPYYLFYPHAPRRVLELLPRVKLIVLLRNPVDRAYSHYQMQKKKGLEPLSFAESIEAEPERLRGEREKMLADENYLSLNYKRYSYLARGIYVDQLQAWLRLFPKEQVLILKSEDFYTNPPAVYKQVLAFLEVPDWDLKEYRIHYRHHYQAMSPELRQRLHDYFEPHNRRLSEFLGTNFAWEC